MNKFLWVDVETGGLDPKINGPHQVAGQIVIDGVTVDEFNLKFQFHPDEVVEQEALDVSDLTIEQVAARDMTSKQGYNEFNHKLCSYVNKYDKLDKFVFCAYNANFDAQFVCEWFIRHGNPYFFGLCHGGAYFDPLNLALLAEIKAGKRLFYPSRKLNVVAEYLGVDLFNAHDALADIRATREVGHKLYTMIVG